MVNIRTCKVSIVPLEVAQNRKRRWSKKFPILITCPSGPRKFKAYLFSPTAREKEDWFRRLRSAANGFTSEQLMDKQKQFFAYMHKYFPSDMLRGISLRPATFRAAPRRRTSGHGNTTRSTHHRNMASTLVQFSKAADNDDYLEDSEPSGGVNITRAKTVQKSKPSSSDYPPMQSSMTSLSSSPSHQGSNFKRDPSLTRTPPLTDREKDKFEVVDYPPGHYSITDDNVVRSPASSLPRSVRTGTESSPNQWLNSIAARLCWDVWNEQRWKDWVMTRIQKKLIRVKTPSFMEQLRLTNIDIGSDMPMVNQLIGGPRLDLQGIWIYLDVTYQGKFVMTIETKMKLGAKETRNGEEDGKQMTTMTSRTKEESK